MTSKQRKIIKLCLVILAVSVVVMAISTFVQVIQHGWQATDIDTFTFAPMGAVAIMLAVILKNEKKDDK